MKTFRPLILLVLGFCVLTFQSMMCCKQHDGPPYFSVGSISLKAGFGVAEARDTILYLEFMPDKFYAQTTGYSFFSEAVACRASHEAGSMGAKETIDSIHCYDLNKYDATQPHLSRVDEQMSISADGRDSTSIVKFNQQDSGYYNKHIDNYISHYLILPKEKPDTIRYMVEVFLSNGQHFEAEHEPFLKTK